MIGEIRKLKNVNCMGNMQVTAIMKMGKGGEKLVNNQTCSVLMHVYGFPIAAVTYHKHDLKQ